MTAATPDNFNTLMGWLRLVGSLKLLVSFAKDPYKRDVISAKETHSRMTAAVIRE